MSAAATVRLLLVRLGAEHFALPLAEVREVTEAPAVAPLPMLPRGVAGQVAHRDRLVPVLDAGALLAAPRDARAGGVLLHVDVAGQAAALWADDVVDVAEVAPAQWRDVPAGGGAAALLAGVVDLGDRIAAVVAMDALRATVRARLHTEAA
mgnify:CR=1 FL=1